MKAGYVVNLPVVSSVSITQISKLRPLELEGTSQLAPADTPHLFAQPAKDTDSVNP